ncbi:dGTP triphosphohydrolase [Desulfocurvus sp.]|jgi:dGTPase|uniref:dGTP triphosphohydrolase n=1 Tax=Desulfocurvus sp. TaxID=2871698 RepID=UPI0025B8E409|nr:dNTP triphosphohydrolase [Desulfocurvus sp.]MCK9239312.1 dNTP triphosphohydrolase [Desulfocurvus sp.]
MTPPDTMRWERLLDSGRYGTDRPEPDPGQDPRSPFERDYDRIVFSGHFRRLGRKTQVHPLNENDHIHTRLSHSMESASLGRSLGVHVGRLLEAGGELPGGLCPGHVGQVVQAACLAHDIGNPPFGHSGEEAIKAWFKAWLADNDTLAAALSAAQRADLTRFDGNAMALRIMVRTGFEENGTGMRPTLAVLGALMKYPRTADNAPPGKDKFSCLHGERSTLEQVAARLGLPGPPGDHRRHPLAFLTEAADDICYRVMDLEDAMELDILPGRFLLDEFKDALEMDAARVDDYAARPRRSRNGSLRAAIMTRAIGACVAAFRDNYDAIMRGEFAPGLLDVAREPASQRLREVYGEVEDRLFRSRRKVELELGAQRSLGLLLDTLIPGALALCADAPPARGGLCTPAQAAALLGRERAETLRAPGAGPYEAAVLVLDYLAGMTDHYATALSRRFMGLGG